MKVVKFGGSSLASGPAVANALKIITSDPERQIVVTSAPGKRHAGDIKVTDLLIRYANQIIGGENASATVEEIFQRYVEIGHYFGVEEGNI